MDAQSPYQLGNFCPITEEGTYRDLKIHGIIPSDLDGIYVRNGTNQRLLPPTGVMHMFDGDAMLHCVRFKEGKLIYYANSWIDSERARANAQKSKDLYSTFGDMTGGGPKIAQKLKRIYQETQQGLIPNLGKHRSHPSTSTLYVGGRFYCLVEVCPPFRVSIDPETGRVRSGKPEDMEGRIEAFTAHPKTDPDSEEVFWFGLPKYTSVQKGMAHYGILSSQGKLKMRFDFPVEKPFPAFLHDYFITEDYAVVVDHSFRMDTSKIAEGSAFLFDLSKNVRFGVILKEPQENENVTWFDTGRCGFVWHVVNGWQSSKDENELILFLNIFDFYPDNVPIHVAEEPSSHLWRYTLNLKNKSVIGEKVLDSIATERNDYNRNRTGRKTEYAYLMKRGEGQEMYDGFLKFNLDTCKVEATVNYGRKRFGGEALFVPKAVMSQEDEGYLLDIIYDGFTGGSELCIWDASNLRSCSDPIARIELPHRVPYGVHANWLSTEELLLQHSSFLKDYSELDID